MYLINFGVEWLHFKWCKIWYSVADKAVHIAQLDEKSSYAWKLFEVFSLEFTYPDLITSLSLSIPADKNVEKISLILVLIYGCLFPRYQSAGSHRGMFSFAGLYCQISGPSDCKPKFVDIELKCTCLAQSFTKYKR